MGSMAPVDLTVTEPVVPKTEPDDELTPSSESLSPEPESATSISGPTDLTGTTLDPPPVPKRKGGRKPIYATSEERKQRNRQAQAAFRERRTEYIKQLETTIQQHEENLASLQQSHRTAADECLMLRYKNSLLERILLEKGIDVQAELRLKGSPHLRPVRHGGMTGQISPMQKAMLNRQQQARQRPSMAPPPIQTVNPPVAPTSMADFGSSPTIQQTPPSQQSSPSTARSPGFSLHGGLTSPQSDAHPNQHQQQFQQPHHRHVQSLQHNPYTQQNRSHIRSMSANSIGQQFPKPHRAQQQAPGAQANYYQSSFQKHYDQLDQEYDAQADMLDDMDGEDMDPDSFIPNFRLPPGSGGSAPMGMQASPPTTTSAASDGGSNLPSIPYDYDPMLDADPFGLTASMHFPSPFGFNQPRR